jgi:hypothetical protein
MAKNIEGFHNNSPFNREDPYGVDRFTTLSPALASYDSDKIADPPPFDGEEPPDPLNLVPQTEKVGKRGAR